MIKKEARLVYGTTEEAHPGVKKVYEKGNIYLGGPIKLLNRPKHDAFSNYHLILQRRDNYFMI